MKPIDERTIRAEAIEIAAHQDMYAADDDAGLGLTTRQIRGGAWAFGSSLDRDVMLNRCVGLGVQYPAERGDLDLVERAYALAGVDRYMIQIVPAAQPGEIGQWIADAGFVPFRRAWAKFWRRAAPVQQTSALAAVEIGPERAAEFAAIIAGAFGMAPPFERLMARLPGRPAWRCYVVLDGERAIAAAAMFVSDRDAWLGLGATAQAARGRGAQPLLLARRVSDAARLGCTNLFTETGEAVPGEPQPSYRNIVEAGLEPIYSRANLIRERGSAPPPGR